MTPQDIKSQVTESLQALQQTGKEKAGQSTLPLQTIRPSDPKRQRLGWYDLEPLKKYTDPIMVLGFGLVIYGVSRFSVVFAIILAGLGLMILSWNLGKV